MTMHYLIQVIQFMYFYVLLALVYVNPIEGAQEDIKVHKLNYLNKILHGHG